MGYCAFCESEAVTKINMGDLDDSGKEIVLNVCDWHAGN